MEEYTIFNFVSDVGAPIAAALFMGAFIFIIIRKIMEDVVGNTEELKGICKMLVTRIKVMNNDMIRIDSMVRTAHTLTQYQQLTFRGDNLEADVPIQASTE